jgi:hypothetical protein
MKQREGGFLGSRTAHGTVAGVFRITRSRIPVRFQSPVWRILFPNSLIVTLEMF